MTTTGLPSFFVDALGFELGEDTPSWTNKGHPKRREVVRPPGGETGLLLARTDGEHHPWRDLLVESHVDAVATAV